MSVAIEKSTLAFLKKLARNNNRDWFMSHRDQYDLAKANAEQFFDLLIAKMNTHDQIETPSGKKSIFRIYNDVRFSKTKDPYSPRFAGYLRRVKPMLRGGYYLWIKPGASRAGCGFVYPNPADLKRIRLDIAGNHEDWITMLNSKSIKFIFGKMKGDLVATAPRGFAKDHPAIDLLRYKQFWFERTFTDEEVLSGGFLNKVNNTYKGIRPFFDYMSYVLGTDLNGEEVRST